VLDYNKKAAWHYGNIRADLERRGIIIGLKICTLPDMLAARD
jgi:predicted nucleic acid-binding protein